MPLVKVKQNYQITLPNSVRKDLNVSVGDYMEIDRQDGGFVLKPVKVVHPDQAYFYTKEWQKGETDADKDIATGDVLGPFDNLTDGLTALKSSKV
ncbi:MAG: AbrB/MazE/SpoVT family DNA-binding domain-containing protein [Deltaproteobacteria bacterium]|nr:AbrB/MazE/SpoVT family DNA-binding domain-containing protein [Deltaproteobacteria bacterium]MBW2675185.1 AbrB/MazE/SpoVT family DNA-binding domain-containing protein [Deltaproteobacteria bacterium]